MPQFGAKVSSEDDKVFRVQPSSYVSPGNMFIEGESLLLLLLLLCVD